MEDVLNEDIPKAKTFTKDEWTIREKSLHSHVRALAEHYRQDLSVLVIGAERAVKKVQEKNETAAVLLYNLKKFKISPDTAQRWILER